MQIDTKNWKVKPEPGITMGEWIEELENLFPNGKWATFIVDKEVRLIEKGIGYNTNPPEERTYSYRNDFEVTTT